MKVLIIPEDFRKDQYILKPITEAMLRFLGKPRAQVRVLTDPLLGGIGEALKWERLTEILERYRMIDLFLLCVDRDGEQSRRQKLNHLEAKARDTLPAAKTLLAENAWQEIEVWALAGCDLPKDWSWQAIRAERDPKDHYFKLFAEQRGLSGEPGEGRKTLGLEAASRYDRVRQLCPEDVAALESRIAQQLEQMGA